MNKNIADFFKAIRKYHGLRQAEMSAILGITQGTVSKLEAAEMKIDMELWFKFAKQFNLKDPYSCVYGGIELEQLDDLKMEELKSLLLPDITFNKHEKYLTSKDMRPLVDYLKEHAPKPLEKIFEKHKIDTGVFIILNHPLPWFLVDEILEAAKSSCGKRELSEIDFSFDSSFGHLGHEFKLNDFRARLDFLQKEVKWCSYEALGKNQYRASFKARENSALKLLKNYEFYFDYLVLLPLLFHSSFERESFSWNIVVNNSNLLFREINFTKKA